MGVKFRHQGRSLSQGFDCIGLVIWTMKELGLTEFDRTHYAARPEEADELSAELARHLVQVPLSEAQPGDVLRFAIVGAALHVGIKSELGVIHAASAYGKVVEHRLDAKWQRRLVQAWRVPEPEKT